jgi:hypothetical protein
LFALNYNGKRQNCKRSCQGDGETESRDWETGDRDVVNSGVSEIVTLTIFLFPCSHFSGVSLSPVPPFPDSPFPLSSDPVSCLVGYLDSVAPVL